MYLGEGFEIVVDELSRLSRGDVHALRQAEGGYAIDDAEVGLLGLLALTVANLIHALFPYLCGGGAVYVEGLAEGLGHVLVGRKVGHDAQFDLTVVGREPSASLIGYETLAYLLAIVVANRDVLQVGIRR